MKKATHHEFHRKFQEIDEPLTVCNPLPGLHEYYHPVLDNLIAVKIDLSYKKNRDYAKMGKMNNTRNQICRLIALKVRDYQCDTGLTVSEYL